jgi:glycosyltransferase involved in cell wall biosynthesis
MARLRLAQALARLGHSPTIISHVPRLQVHRGVTYLPLDMAGRVEQTDILIMISSGGALSLESAANLNVKSRLREVWVEGTIPVKGVNELQPDYVIPASNFLHETIASEWELASGTKLSVIYNGAPLAPGRRFRLSARDPYSLAYASHPSKGLEASLGVLNILRKTEPRFKLHVFGGDALWGGQDHTIADENVVFHGTCGQQKVLQALCSINFSMNLQQRPEPFGMVLTEAMLHGCLPIASPVGAYNELIRDRGNGFLVTGAHNSPVTQQKAASLILSLVKAPIYLEYVRHQAQAMPWTWDRQARVWVDHWDWVLCQRGETAQDYTCHFCGGCLLLWADGLHCADCGRYFQNGMTT